MNKSFSLKNMAIAALIGALVTTNFHAAGLSAADMAIYTAIMSVAAWAAVEEVKIRNDQRRKERGL